MSYSVSCVCPMGGVLWSPGEQQSGLWSLHIGSHDGGHDGVCHVMCQHIIVCVSVSGSVSCVCPTGRVLRPPGRHESGRRSLHAGSHDGRRAG